jgi:hypothetical protein
MDEVEHVQGVRCHRTRSDGSIETYTLLEAKQDSYDERKDRYNKVKPALEDAEEIASEYSSDNEVVPHSDMPYRKLNG